MSENGDTGAVAPGLGLKGPGGSGFGMLSPRARASLPDSHPGRLGGGRGGGGQRPQARGDGEEGSPGPEGEPRTKGGAGLSPGGHRVEVRGAPRAVPVRALASGPRAWEAAG